MTELVSCGLSANLVGLGFEGGCKGTTLLLLRLPGRVRII